MHQAASRDGRKQRSRDENTEEGSREGADRWEIREPGSEAESRSKTRKKWGDTEAAGNGMRAQEGVTERKRQRKMGPRRQRQTEHTQVRNRVREMQAKRQTDRGERTKCV